MTSDWKDREYQRKPLKIMVIGVTKKPENKRIFEDEFVRQLKTWGTDAVASYTVIPDEMQGDHAVIAAKMKEEGADAVLISRLANKKTVYASVPEKGIHPPYFYGNWREYYGYGSKVVYTSEYTAEDEYALMEINLYNARNDKLIWTALSETDFLGSDRNQIISYIGVMVKAMVDRKLLQWELWRKHSEAGYIGNRNPMSQ